MPQSTQVPRIALFVIEGGFSMGHIINYGIYKNNINKNEVQEYWDNYVSHEAWQEGSTGLPKKIRWIDKICNSMTEAEEYIEKHDDGWYDQLAVRFRDTDVVPKTSATKEKLLMQIERYKLKKKEYNEIHSFANCKAEFISCPFCKSKISKLHLVRKHNITGTYGCPICNASDIRADYIIKKLQTFQIRIDKWGELLKEEERKLAKKVSAKAEVKWLVKIEYHV